MDYMDIYEKNITSCNDVSIERADGLHKLLLVVLEYDMSDFIYKMIIDWNIIDVLCYKLSNDELLNILNLSKKCNIITYYRDFNNPSYFNVFDNIRDIYELNDRLDVLNGIEN